MTAPLRLAAALALLTSASCSTARTAGTTAPPLPLPRAGLEDDSVRVVLFGDSNTDAGWSGTNAKVRVRSYVSDGPPRVAAGEPHSTLQLAGKIERDWRACGGAPPIRVANHAISGTTTGGGGHGGRDRNRNGAPNARTTVDGITRFEGEVLSVAHPWSGGEPTGAAYPAGPIRRVNAFMPDANDFAYVSLGTNDLADGGMPPSATLDNLAWMVDRWAAAGHASDHLILTTLAPRLDRDLGDAIPTINAGVRALAARSGAGLIDLAAFTSADGGRSWRSPDLHIGDRLHYAESVRDWLAAQTVAYVRAHLARRPGAVRSALDTAALERVLLEEMRESRAPGVAIAVVRGDQVVYQKGFGVASVESGEPVTPTTLFRIGSTTKMVTGLTAVLLGEEGKVRLSSPIGDYTRGLAPELSRLTLDELLTHRAGMVNEASGAGPHDDAALGARVRGWGKEHVMGPAGDIYSYSGPGYWLAGYAIEEGAKRPYADVVRERVLVPLGMTRSTFRPLAAMTYPFAQDHRVGTQGPAVLRPFTDDVTTWASGSLFSSASELARLTTALVNGGRLDGKQALSASAVAEVVAPRAAMPGDDACRYGYGLAVCRHGGVRTLSHYGFRVGSGSVIIMAPDSQAAVIVLANRNGGILARTAWTAMKLVAGVPGPDAAGPGRAGDSARGRTERFVGTYANGPDTLRIVRDARGLRYRYGAEESAARLAGADAIVVLGADGAPTQRFLLVDGAASHRPYLYDGLTAFARLGEQSGPGTR